MQDIRSKSDAELVKELKNGHQVAFNELVRRYKERVYWVARRMVGSHDDADDIAQEVFIKVYRSIDSFREESSFYTWVYRIATNTSINFLKRKKLRELIRFDDLVAPLISVEDQPDETIEREENTALIERAIQRLPQKQRQVFIMRYYDELSYEEMAKILKKSVGGLKANYFHALKKIKEFMRNAK